MAADPDAVAAISPVGTNDALPGKMRALVQNMAEGVAARPKVVEGSVLVLVAAARGEAAEAKAHLGQARKQVEAYRERDADLVASVEDPGYTRNTL